MSRIPSLVRAGACLVLLVVGALAPTSQAQNPAGDPEAEPPRGERAAVRAEDAVARALVQLDENLELHTFPDGSAEWPARLAAAIEARDEHAPGQELLRGLAAELRGLRVDHPFGRPPGAPPGARPALTTPAGRERARGIARIREQVELVNRKLGLGGHHGPSSGISGTSTPRLAPRVFLHGSDLCTHAPEIGTGYFEGWTSSATSDGSSSCDGPTPSPDVWYLFTAPETDSYSFETVDTFDGVFDTVLSLHSACPMTGDPHELACSDDTTGSLLSSISYPLTEGEQVWVRVTGYGGATGEFDLRVSRARTISGSVVRNDTGAPIPGATIEIFGGSGIFAGRSVSGADGSYSASVPLVLGDFHARVRHPHWVTQVYDGRDCELEFFCNPSDGTDISVTTTDASGIDFALRPAGAITGTVESGDPTGNVPFTPYVYLYEADGSFRGSAGTDPSGGFGFSSVPPGDYILYAGAGGHRQELWEDVPCDPTCVILDGTPVEVVAGSTTSGIDFVLDRLGRIRGTVTRSDNGDPVLGVLVTIADESGSGFSSDYTDAGGAYEVGFLEPGVHFARTSSSLFFDEAYDDVACEPTCDVTTGDPILAEDNTAISGIDFVLQPKASISGEVTDLGSGYPASSRVYLYDSSGEPVTSRRTYIDLAKYSFTALDAGTYYLRAGYETYDYPKSHEGELYDDIPCPGGCDVTAGTAVVAGPTSQVTGIDFALDRRGSIAGRVVLAGTSAPLESQVVKAYHLDGSEAGGAESGAGGAYEIINLTAGTYRVGTQLSVFADEMYDDVPCSPPCDRTTGATVSVTAGQRTSGIDFAVDPLGSIAGACYEGATGFSAGVLVSLFDESGQPMDDFRGFGSYFFEGLYPGTYYLVARDDDSLDDYQDELYLDVPCDPDCDVTQGTPLVIELGTALSGVDFRLAVCPVESYAEVVSTTVDSYYKVLACDRITASDTTLETGADLLLRSGRTVVLGDGFSMAPGAKLQVVIDPAWADH